MARTNTLTNFLTDVADSIRSKTGKSEPIACEDFDTEIESISGGGSANLQTKSVTITTNTTTNIVPDSGYDGMSSVSVVTNVSGASEPTLGFVVEEWSTKGRPKKLTMIGDFIYTGINTGLSYYFYNYNSTAMYSGWDDLEEVTFRSSSSFGGLGNGTFYHCRNLKKIILPSSITSLTVSQNTFAGCEALETIENLPNTISQYGSSIFYGCSLLRLSILPTPTSSTIIANGAFYNCRSLAVSSLPSNITSIDANAFYGCSNIAISELPSSLTTIGYAAFYNCSKITISCLEYITTSFGNSVFSGCSLITPTKLSDNLNVNALNGANGMFRDCTSITKFDFTTSYYIPYSCMYGCTSLVSVIMENARYIQANTAANGTFYNCTSLKAAWIGSGITSANFQRYVFQGCTSLEYIYIDLPRATVEAFTYYSTKWSNNTVPSTCQVICNDDNNFITATEFRNTDWSLV